VPWTRCFAWNDHARRAKSVRSMMSWRMLAGSAPIACDRRQMITQSLFFPGNREIFKKNREAIEHERAITERD
jgi:hypothetical protein